MTNGLPSALAGRCIRVRWSAVLAASTDRLEVCREQDRAHCVVTFVIALQFVDDHHALLEAWLRTPAGIRNTLPRQPVICEVAADDRPGGLLHVDAHLDGQRVLAVSLDPSCDGNGSGHGRLMYAQSTLPADAGFTPGACDRPTATILAAEQDAVSA
jgi:hypothetical protein